MAEDNKIGCATCGPDGINEVRSAGRVSVQIATDAMSDRLGSLGAQVLEGLQVLESVAPSSARFASLASSRSFDGLIGAGELLAPTSVAIRGTRQFTLAESAAADVVASAPVPAPIPPNGGEEEGELEIPGKDPIEAEEVPEDAVQRGEIKSVEDAKALAVACDRHYVVTVRGRVELLRVDTGVEGTTQSFKKKPTGEELEKLKKQAAQDGVGILQGKKAKELEKAAEAEANKQTGNGASVAASKFEAALKEAQAIVDAIPCPPKCPQKEKKLVGWTSVIVIGYEVEMKDSVDKDGNWRGEWKLFVVAYMEFTFTFVIRCKG